MKRFLLGLTIGLLILFQGLAWADSPIYQGFFWDSAPAAAYNSTKGEFLVVWNVFNPLHPPTEVRFFGPVMGQLISESGQKIGESFEIFNAGVLPKVAYNAQANEYLVVAEQWYNTVGQRVSAVGLKPGGPVTLLTNARYPRVVYNSKAGTYLVTGAWLPETAPGSGICNIQLYARQVSTIGQPLGSPVVVADEPHGACADGAIYALDYAPLETPMTPEGRYLLAIRTPTRLKMLGSQGQALLTLFNPQSNTWYDSIPFDQYKVGDPFHIDVAYGTMQGSPVFFLVWGDRDQTVSGGKWTGIWGGLVDAQKELYLTIDVVSNTVFPISYQWEHWPYYKEWRPVVKYNNPSNRFVLAWRETPGDNPSDPTTVNHIRVNTVNSTTIPPQQNIVVSSTTGTENPVLPALASSTKTSKVILAWEDYRNFLGDIYGTLFDASTRSTSGINPGGSGPVYWKSVSAGRFHTLGIRSDASLWAWGHNGEGELGIGNTNEQHSPAQVVPGSTWVQVSSGMYHTLGIRSDTSLWAWGANYIGQLGIGNTSEQHSPSQVIPGSTWAQVSAGGEHTLGIRSDASLWAWGANYSGELGLGDPLQEKHDPTQVGVWSDWRDISAGGGFSHGIRSDGSAWAWGDNGHWALGVGDIFDRHIPDPVMDSSGWLMVDNGGAHALGIKNDNSLRAWGGNGQGQLGLGFGASDEMSPTLVPGGSDWSTVSAGGLHSLGIRSDGSLWSWGYNYYGQLGIGEDLVNKWVPTRVGNWLDWVAVYAGANYSLGIRGDGSLWAWGLNSNGQLGLGDTQERHVPTRVLLPNTMIWLPLILKN